MSGQIVEKRKAILDINFEAARSKHEKRSRELSAQTHKAGVVLITWGFLFVGISGLYQAGVFKPDNTQQIITLLIPFLASTVICVLKALSRQEENDVPNLPELWGSYVDAHKEGYASYDEVVVKEQLTQAYIEAEGINRIRLGQRAYWMALASWGIVLEIIVIAIFVIMA